MTVDRQLPLGLPGQGGCGPSQKKKVWRHSVQTPYSGAQAQAITRMCMALGDREPLEETPANGREARVLMFELRERLRCRRLKTRARCGPAG